ncbi:hypothetical protein BDZ89DRAFT_1046844 [Hymenopellis radicata]|nr:hypothetical protein BDZ89DRAFT_1046844 [Hymenopellis radicata]
MSEDTAVSDACQWTSCFGEPDAQGYYNLHLQVVNLILGNIAKSVNEERLSQWCMDPDDADDAGFVKVHASEILVAQDIMGIVMIDGVPEPASRPPPEPATPRKRKREPEDDEEEEPLFTPTQPTFEHRVINGYGARISARTAAKRGRARSMSGYKTRKKIVTTPFNLYKPIWANVRVLRIRNAPRRSLGQEAPTNGTHYLIPYADPNNAEEQSPPENGPANTTNLNTPELCRARIKRFMQGKFRQSTVNFGFSASAPVVPSVPVTTPSNIAASASALHPVIAPPPPAVPPPWGPAVRRGKPKPKVPPLRPTGSPYGSTVTRTLAAPQTLPSPRRAPHIDALAESSAPSQSATSAPESEHDAEEDELDDTDAPPARPARTYKPRGRPPIKTQPGSQERQRQRQYERSYEERNRPERNKQRAENSARRRAAIKAERVAYAASKSHHTQEMRLHRRKNRDTDSEQEVEEDIEEDSEEERGRRQIPEEEEGEEEEQPRISRYCIQKFYRSFRSQEWEESVVTASHKRYPVTKIDTVPALALYCGLLSPPCTNARRVTLLVVYPRTMIRAGWRTELHDSDLRVILYPANQDAPPIPSGVPLNPRNLADHGQYRHIRYLAPHFAYLALIAKRSPFHDHAFYSLAYGPMELPVTYTSGKGYHLSVAVQEAWTQTFRVIRRTANYLGGIAKSNIPAQRPWTWPEQYGYTRFHATRDSARQAALGSQQAFIPWIAYATFYVGVIQFEQDRGIATHHQWRYSLRKAMLFDEAWGLAMESSCIFDHGLDRLGAYFAIGGNKDIEVSPDELVMMQVLWSFRAPIYLDWGSALKMNDIRGLLEDSHVPIYPYMHPSRREIRILIASHSIKREPEGDAVEHAQCDLQDETNIEHRSLPSVADAAPLEDSLPPGVEAQLTKNGQVVYRDAATGTTSRECPASTPVDNTATASPATLRLPSPQEFLKKRADEYTIKAQNEDTKERQRRLGKERAAHGRNPIRNASFFLWTESAGVWLREELDREDGTEIFQQEQFTSSQTVYNGFSNSYDFCTAFDATAVSLGTLRDEDTAEELYGMTECTAVDEAALDPRSFWAQRVAGFNEQEAHESPLEHVARRGRENLGQSTMVPDSDASVFVWEIRAADGSLRQMLPPVDSPERACIRWVRRRLNSGDIEASFNNAQSTQVRFDPFRNEWDISWAFDPTCVARGVYKAYRPQVDDTFGLASTIASVSDQHNPQADIFMDTDMPLASEVFDDCQESVPFFHEKKILDDLGWMSSRYLDLPHVNGPVNGEGLLREFFENFGMTVGRDSDIEDEQLQPKVEDIQPLLQAVGFCRSHIPASFSLSWLSAQQWNRLLYAFKRLRLVRPDRLSQLDGKLPQIMDLANINSDLFHPIGFPIAKASFADDDRSFWLIDAPPQSDHLRWQLAIPLPRTLVLILRMGWGPDPRRIIPELVRRCIPFFWLVHANEPINQPAIRPRGNGYRPKEYQPTTQDFLAAEMTKIDFLRGARGYAAFFSGSLFARWANEYADGRSIALGPTRNVLWPGKLRRLLIDGEMGPLVYDPSLTDAEVETLMGATQILSDHTMTGPPWIKSWWPSPGTWNSRVISAGMWGVAAQDWLDRRRTGLLAGQPKWNTNSNWRTNLLYRSAYAMEHCKEYDDSCAAYIEAMTSLIERSNMDEYVVS